MLTIYAPVSPNATHDQNYENMNAENKEKNKWREDYKGLGVVKNVFCLREVT